MEIMNKLASEYESQLAINNKDDKKSKGQYYTPTDVAQFNAKKLFSLYEDGDNVADVCCGCGNLIAEFLSLDVEVSKKIIENKKLYLYDIDENAVDITIERIADIVSMSKNNVKKLTNIFIGDFLDDDVSLPPNTITISNPPYGSIPKNNNYLFYETSSTSNYYALFSEKISKQSKHCVLIIPQSFVGISSSYSCLRDVFLRYGGEIYSFDNRPGNIFCGKKKGIFNTNTENSVRTSFVVINKKKRGFRLTPLIRFGLSERDVLFDNLDNLLGDYVQTENIFKKVPKALEPFVHDIYNSKITVEDVIEKSPKKQNPKYKLTIPSTLRYYISATHRDLDRSSKIVVYAKDKQWFDTLYVLFNSSLLYLWWRMLEGEITITKEALYSFPVISLNNIQNVVEEGLSMEDNCLTLNKNAGRINENVKFPDEYRDKLNRIVLESVNSLKFLDELTKIHNNHTF